MSGKAKKTIVASKKPVEKKNIRAKAANAGVTVIKVAKTQPKAAGVTKRGRIKKRQSDRILKAMLDGASLYELQLLVSELKQEEDEAVTKREAKKNATNKSKQEDA